LIYRSFSCGSPKFIRNSSPSAVMGPEVKIGGVRHDSERPRQR
jgi:hypothetical protein